MYINIEKLDNLTCYKRLAHHFHLYFFFSTFPLSDSSS